MRCWSAAVCFRGPRRKPAKRLRWGEEEGMEWAESSPKAGTEQSGISSDEPRPDTRYCDLLDAQPQPGEFFRHPLGQDGGVQRGQLLCRNVHGILPPLKSVGVHEPPDVLVGPLEKLRILRRFLMGIVLSQRLLVQIKGDLFSAPSHATQRPAPFRPGPARPPRRPRPARRRRRRSPGTSPPGAAP